MATVINPVLLDPQDVVQIRVQENRGLYRRVPTCERDRVGRLLSEGKLDEAERVLRANPGLIHDDGANWGDGMLAGPAHAGRHDVIAMLMRLGARVPPVSKWAPYYYFKHEATAAFLLAHGMDPNHMNWQSFIAQLPVVAEGLPSKAWISQADQELSRSP